MQFRKNSRRCLPLMNPYHPFFFQKARKPPCGAEKAGFFKENRVILFFRAISVWEKEKAGDGSRDYGMQSLALFHRPGVFCSDIAAFSSKSQEESAYAKEGASCHGHPSWMHFCSLSGSQTGPPQKSGRKASHE